MIAQNVHKQGYWLVVVCKNDIEVALYSNTVSMKNCRDVPCGYY